MATRRRFLHLEKRFVDFAEIRHFFGQNEGIVEDSNVRRPVMILVLALYVLYHDQDSIIISDLFFFWPVTRGTVAVVNCFNASGLPRSRRPSQLSYSFQVGSQAFWVVGP